MPSHKVSVLVIDDEPLELQAQAEWLERKLKARIWTATSAAEAIEILHRRSPVFDLVFLDQNLPGPISGLDVLAQIKAEFPETFVVMLAANTSREGMEALRRGAYRYIPKPPNNDEILFLVENIAEIRQLQRRRSEDTRLVSAMREISEAIASDSMDQLLQRIASVGQRLLEVPVFVVWYQDTPHASFRVKATAGLVDERYRTTVTIDPDTQATRDFLLKRGPLALPHIQSAARYQHKEAAKQRGWESLLTVPVAWQSRFFGILDAYSDAMRTFTDSERELLAAFAAQAALAIRQSTLLLHTEKIGRVALAGDLDVLYQTVVDAVHDLTGTPVSLWMIEGGRSQEKKLRIRAARDLDSRYMAMAELSLDPTQSIVAASLSQRKPLARADLEDLTLLPPFHYSEEAIKWGWKSFVSVPLLGATGQPLGALSIYGKEVKAYSEEETLFLLGFAHQAAVAFEDVNRRRQLEKLVLVARTVTAGTASGMRFVLEKAAEAALELLDASSAAIYPYDPERALFYDERNVVIRGAAEEEQLKRKPREQGLAATVRRIGELFVSDMDAGMAGIENRDHVAEVGIDPVLVLERIKEAHFLQRNSVRSFAALSLTTGDDEPDKDVTKEVGILYINFKEPHQFGEDERNVIRVFGYQIGAAIYSAHLLKKREQISALRDASEALRSGARLEEVAEKILDELGKVIGYKKATVQRLEKDGDRRTLLGYRGFDQSEIDQELLGPLSQDALMSEVMQSREPRIEADTAKCKGWRPKESTRNVRSWAGVPLVYSERVLGFITLDHNQENFYNNSHRELLSSLATHAAVAIHNFDLYRGLEILNEAGKELNSRQDEAGVLDKLLTWVNQSLGCDYSTIFAANEENELAPIRRLGGELKDIVDLRFKMGEGLAGWVAQQRAPELVNDVRNDRRFRPGRTTSPHRPHSMLLVPILLPSGRLYGVVSVDREFTNGFDTHDREVLSTLAAQAGVALENALLHNLQRQLVEMGQKLSEAATDLASTVSEAEAAVKRTVQCDVARVLPYDSKHNLLLVAEPETGNGRRFKVQPKSPRKQGTMREILEHGRVVVEDTQDLDRYPFLRSESSAFIRRNKIRSFLGIPLKVGDEITGALYANFTRTRHFSDTELSLVSAVANPVAVAIQNAVLFDKVRQRAQAMLLLETISTDISSERQLEKTLDRLIQGAIKLSDTKSGVIRLVDRKTGLVTHSYEYPPAFGHPPSRFGMNKGMTWHIVETGEAVVVPDVSQTEYDVNPELKERGVVSYVGVPIKRGDDTLGALFLNDNKVRPEGTLDIELLQILASDAAIAIRNAQIRDSLEQRVDDLKALKTLSQGLNTVEPGTTAEMARTLWHAVKDLMDTRYFFVASCDEQQSRVQFDFVVQDGVEVKDRTGEWQPRIGGSGLTEVVMRNGLCYIREDVGKERERLGATDGLRGGVRWEDWLVERDVRVAGESWLGVPIKAGDKTLGVIGVENYEAPNAYDEGDVEVLQTVAEQLAIAMVRSKLNRKTKELEALTVIGHTVSNLPIDDILDKVYEQMGKIMILTDAQVQFALNDDSSVKFPLAVEQDNGKIIDRVRWARRIAADGALADEVEQFHERPSGVRFGLTEYVIASKRSRLLVDEFKKAKVAAADDDSFVLPVSIHNPETGGEEQRMVTVWRKFGLRDRSTNSWLGVPLIVQDRVIGVISVQSLGEEPPVDQDQLTVLETIASQAAVAIDNARLYDQMERLVDERTNTAMAERNKRLENEKWVYLGQTAASLAHRIGNKGGIVRLCATDLRETVTKLGVSDQSVYDKLDMIQRNNQYLLELSDNLFRPAEASRTRLVNSALRLLLNDALLNMNVPPDVQVEIDESIDNLPPLPANKFFVEVFGEIIGNAVAAMEQTATKCLRIEGKVEDGFVELRFDDTGRGMSEQQRQVLFELFSPAPERHGAKSYHRGFGLWWVRSFLASIGGEVFCESELNRGSTFTVRLPFLNASAAARS